MRGTIPVTTSRPVLTLKRGKRGEKPSGVGHKGEAVARKGAAVARKGEAIARGAALARKSAASVKKKQTPPPQEHTGTDDDLLAALQAMAPDLWNPGEPVPLAVGIHKQIYPVAEKVRLSRRSLRRFLSRWTSSAPYQKALLAPDAQRFNLDGSVAESVSEQHQSVARERVGE